MNENSEMLKKYPIEKENYDVNPLKICIAFFFFDSNLIVMSPFIHVII